MTTTCLTEATRHGPKIMILDAKTHLTMGTTTAATILGEHLAQHRSTDRAWDTTMELATAMFDIETGQLDEDAVMARIHADKCYDSEANMAARALTTEMTARFGESITTRGPVPGAHVPQDSTLR